MSMKITTIFKQGSATSSVGAPRRPEHLRAKHILIIDLESGSGPEIAEDSDSSPSSVIAASENEGSMKEFLCRLKDLVAKDQAQPEEDRIDMVSTTPAWFRDEIWEALDGLRPKHLELKADETEDGTLEYLDKLKTPWPLESLIINSIASSDQLFPKSTATIRSLLLYFCHAAPFQPPGGATNLEELTITHNDAQLMFVETFDANPLLPSTLRSLKITSVDGALLDFQYDESLPIDFQVRMAKCTNLRSVDLALADNGYDPIEDHELAPGRTTYSFVDIPQHLPRFVERLAFQGPCSERMLTELASWIQHAKNSTWLPNLTTIAFSTSLEVREASAPPSALLQGKLESAKEELFDFLRARSPPVEVVEKI